MSAQPKPTPHVSPDTPAKIVWHFGFQKTGTTSIQSVCWRNFDAMSEHAALFPKRRWTHALRDTAMAFTEGRGEAEAFAATVEEIAQQVAESGRSSALVSDENVLGLDVYNDHGHIFDFAAAVLPVVERAAWPCQSEFVFYTRSMDRWLKSAHSQAVGWTRLAVDYETWRAGIPFETDWSVQHSRLQSVTDAPVIFRNMSQDRKEGVMLGTYLFDRSGIPHDVLAQLLPARAKNERMSEAALDFMLDINSSRLNDRALNVVRQYVKRNMHLFQTNTED